MVCIILDYACIWLLFLVWIIHVYMVIDVVGQIKFLT